MCRTTTEPDDDGAAAVTASQQEKFYKLPPPEPSSWPNRPVYVKAHRDTHVVKTTGAPATATAEPLPLGTVVDFESPLFRGKMILRMRTIEQSDNPEGDRIYFEDRKRFVSFVVQGQFKEKNLSMADVYEGNHYDRPFKGIPKFAESFMKTFMKRIMPGLELDLTSDQPRIMTLLASCAQKMSVNQYGEEPDISSRDIPENTSLVMTKKGEFKSNVERQKYFAKPKNASQYTYDTELVYTFEIYQDVLDIATYYLHLPMGLKIDLAKVMNGQPVAHSAMTKNGRFLYDFTIWHERLLQYVTTTKK